MYFIAPHFPPKNVLLLVHLRPIMINVFPLGPGQTIVSTQVRVFLGFAKAISHFDILAFTDMTGVWRDVTFWFWKPQTPWRVFQQPASTLTFWKAKYLAMIPSAISASFIMSLSWCAFQECYDVFWHDSECFVTIYLFTVTMGSSLVAWSEDFKNNFTMALTLLGNSNEARLSLVKC